jgi:hypothetical protein
MLMLRKRVYEGADPLFVNKACMLKKVRIFCFFFLYNDAKAFQVLF